MEQQERIIRESEQLRIIKNFVRLGNIYSEDIKKLIEAMKFEEEEIKENDK